VRSYSLFDDSYRKEILARVDGSGCKQRDRMRDCYPNGPIWIHTRESILYCVLLLQRVELA
jgi:hypothetical protein